MKRMIAFLVLVVMMIALCIASANFVSPLDYESIIVVSSQANLFEGEVIKSGSDYYYLLDKSEANALNEVGTEEIKGIVYYFSDDKDIGYFNDRLCSLSCGKEIAGRTVYYGYDKSYNDFRLIGGKKINFQLARTEEGWILGYPMIITGF